MSDHQYSILNPHPRRLAGQSLLHECVTAPSDAPALEHLHNDSVSTFTYKELHLAADRVAHRIRRLAGQERTQHVVPLLLAQSPLLYATILGILKAGAAFCPLNVDIPHERLKFILQDVSASLIIVSEDLRDRLPALIDTRVLVVSDSDLKNGEATAPSPSVPPREVLPSDTAYVMYTSGSTGTPKGVALSHDAATQALLAHDGHIPQFSRFLQFAAPTFDVSVFEIFFPLMRGKALISCNRVQMLDNLPATLRKMEVDACELTPSVAAGLLKRRDAAPCLKVLLTIGEMLNASVVQEFGGSDSRSSMLWAMYGPTEATIHCTFQPAFSAFSAVGNIGRPLETVSCFVIDPEQPMTLEGKLNILPRGESGELAVGGHQLADGYLNRQEQTDSAFLHSDYGRIYRTGDRARLNNSGTLECLGRLSEGQVKLRGQRIELGEVEHALLRAEGCHLAVAAVVDSILVGFCVVDKTTSEEAILETCAEWVTPAMVPGEIILLDDIPRLPSGKIDRAALKADFAAQKQQGEANQETLQPEDEAVSTVVDALVTTLGVHARPSDKLASIGLDSLRAIKLSSTLLQAGARISVAGILRSRTVSDLCQLLRQGSSAGPHESRNVVDSSMADQVDLIILETEELSQLKDDIESIMPCTPLQSAMLAAKGTDPLAYSNEIELEASAQFSKAELKNALWDVCMHNEALRTGFVQWRGRLLSIIFRKPRRFLIHEDEEPTEQNLVVEKELDWLGPVSFTINNGTESQNHHISLRIHHAIYDGWSLDALLSDFNDRLRAQVIPNRPQFRDVANFILSSDSIVTERSMRFWADHLSGWDRVPFPKLVSRPAKHPTSKAVRQTLSMEAFQLDHITKQTGCGNQAVFLAALALVWQGIAGTNDLVLGNVSSGRDLPIRGIDSIIGPCIASTPLRMRFDDIKTVEQLIRYTDTVTRQTMEHSSLPQSDIRKAAGLQAWEGLYDVLFVYQESLYSSKTADAAVKQVSHLDRLETKLLVEVEPTPTGFALQATYRTDAIDSATATSILNQLACTSQRLLTSLDVPVQELTSTSDMDLAVFNHPHKDSRGELDLATAFVHVATKCPEAIALNFATLDGQNYVRQSVSFAALNERANQCAHYIRKQGCKEGDVVAIVMEKSIDLYIAILAIVKAGCAYLPLVPSTPRNRIVEIFRQAQIKCCLVDDVTQDAVQDISGPSYLNATEKNILNMKTDELKIAADGERLAYVIYTSGTTGVPKGVAITQKNISSNIAYLMTQYPYNDPHQSRLLQACSQAFDVSVFEIFYTWLSGMCLCSGTNDTVFSDIERTVREFDVTHLSLTPTVAGLVNPKNVPSVQFLVTAGEPLTRAVLDSWGSLLWQGYGPSETTNICTVKRMSRHDNIEHLGEVFPNTSVVVLATDGTHVVPIGWVGELCYGGEQVAQGYYREPGLTAEKFIQHSKYGRLYRSGDLGRMLPDGSLVTLGRLDGQVKLRGQRIESAEIDRVLTTHGGVQSSATLLLNSHEDNGKAVLVSFWTQNAAYDNADLCAQEVNAEAQAHLRAKLQSHLPSYMIPSYAIPVSGIPRTSSGKCDRKKLTDLFDSLLHDYIMSSALSGLAEQDDGEWTDQETKIRDVIASSLDCKANDVGRWTSFATIGLDSISAMKVSRDLTAALSTHVAISTLSTHSCVALLARHLGTATTPDLSSITEVEQQLVDSSLAATAIDSFAANGMTAVKVLPCTPLQEAMLANGRGYYNRTLFRVNIAQELMQDCWNQMVQRHEILRTCFISTPKKDFPFAQIILKDGTINWKTYTNGEGGMLSALEDHMSTLPEPADSQLPPWSLAFIARDDALFLSFICHHSLYDGTAISVLCQEVETVSRGTRLPPPVPFDPFIREMRRRPKDCEEFWTSKLKNFEPSLYFEGSTGPTNGNQAILTLKMEQNLVQLQKQMRSLKTSLLALCQAAWANTLAITTGLTDVTFGNVVSGRTVNVPDVERLVAPCFNTVPSRQVLDSSLCYMDLLESLKSENETLVPYQFTPLREIQRRAGSSSMFDTLVLVQPSEVSLDADIWTLEEDVGEMGIPLVCEVVPDSSTDTIAVNIHYNSELMREAEANTLADGFTRVMHSITSSPFANVVLEPSFGLERKLRRPKPIAPQRQEDKLTASEEQWSNLEIAIRRAYSLLSQSPESKISHETTTYRLGLDSINAVQIASMLRDEGYTVSTVDVLQYPTCEKLAGHIANGVDTKDGPVDEYDLVAFREAIHLDKVLTRENATIEDVLPCTPVQCAMLASSAQSQGSAYVNLICLDMNDTLSVHDIRSAWRQVKREHHMLRTCFVEVDHPDSSFAMVRYTDDCLKLPLIESRESDTKFIEHIKMKSAQEFAAKPELPPWQVVLQTADRQVRMYLVLHHALYDAKSLQCILDNLARSLRNETLEPTQDPSIGLSEVMNMSKIANDTAADFWRGLAGDAVVNRFPVLTPLREKQTQPLTKRIRSKIKFSALQGKSRELGVSVQTVIEATWTRLLAAYTGEDSCLFGVTMSGRLTDATKNTPIPCLNTVPIIVQNKESDSELLDALQDYDAQLSSFRYSPVSKMQSWLGHPGSQLFDTLITYQGPTEKDSTPRPWEVVAEVGQVEFPISLEVEPGKDDEVYLALTHQPALLPTDQAAILIDQFDMTMCSMLNGYSTDDSTRRLADIQPELFSILPAEVPDIATETTSLHQFVETQARERPDSIALEFAQSLEQDTQRWTYAELNDLGDRVSQLVRQRAQPGSIVAIHFDKCPEAYMSILGILKSGCAFVALDPSMPTARKEFILQDSAAQCLLLGSGVDLGIETNTPILRVDRSALAEVDLPETPIQVNGSDVCYCLYTSGTTGTPKGCEITHENAVQAMMAFQHLFRGRWTSDSRWLQFAALHFDVSILEQYWSWSVGITMVAAPRDVILDDLAGAITTLNITHIDLTPSLARLLHPDDVSCLWNGVFITGGESLKQEILDVWGPKAVIFNSYGPTEATIGVTTYPQVPQNGRPSNIGKQFLNVATYVLGPGTDQPVLRGAVGELCIAGKLVGKGYLNRGELTTEKFPYLPNLGQRVYRTGDLVRVLADGCFDFLGRADDQVKLRGQRLEIGEINHAMRMGVPDIHDVATLVVTERSNDRSLLVAFIVGEVNRDDELEPLTDDNQLAERARAACRAKLPGYMVPSHFIILPYMPLSNNNKTETKVLKQIFEKLTPAHLAALNPVRTTTTGDRHKELIDKIRKALSNFTKSPCDDLPASANIFDLGLDSINVLRFKAALKAQGIATSETALLLKNPVIADLAEALADRTAADRTSHLIQDARMTSAAWAQRHHKTACEILGLSSDEIEYILPCSPLQEGMVSAALTRTPRGVYFVSIELLLDDSLDLDKLRAAWSSLVEMHAILRTAFLITSDGCIQVALRDPDLRWEFVDTESQRDDRRQLWLAHNHDHVLAPLQFTLLRGPGSTKLTIDIFHGIYDGTSLDNMLRDVQLLYQGSNAPASAPFKEALIHGPLWRHDYCKEFWKEHLRDWTSNSVWPSQSSVSSAEPTEESKSLSLSKVLSRDQLDALLKSHRVTMQALMLALWVSALETRKQDDTAVGLILGGRSLDLDHVQDTIGPLFNTLPFYSGSCRDSTWDDLMQHCHQFCSDTLSFQHTPLKSIQSWCSGGRQIFNNLFTVQIEPPQPKPADSLWRVASTDTTPDYPLALEVLVQSDGDVKLTLVSQSHIVGEKKAAGLLQLMAEALTAVNADPSARWRTHTSTSSSQSSTTGIDTPDTLDDVDGFEWTPPAEAIRNEMANLAQINPDTISETISFLQLGLDSIDALKLSSRLRQQGIEVPASHIIRHQTIQAILEADGVRNKVEPKSGTDSEHLKHLQERLWSSLGESYDDASEIEAVYPATPLQEGMVVGMIESDFKQYFNHETLELATNVDLKRLEQAWSTLISQNPVLRTGFAQVNDGDLDFSYYQVVYQAQTFEIERLRQDHASTNTGAADAAMRVAKDTRGRDKLLQVKFVLQGNRKYMVISMAHALYDGWSLGLMYNDLAETYREVSIADRPTCESFIASRILVDQEDARKFWGGYLQGASRTILSPASRSSAVQSVHREALRGSGPISNITAFCKKYSVSLQTLCYAAWAAVLAKHSRKLDVAFGAVLSGRDFDGAEELMFPTMNTVAYRAILHGSCASFLNYLESNMRKVRSYQNFPLRKAQRLAVAKGDLFDTLFMMQRSPISADSEPLFWSVGGDSTVEYPLCIESEALHDALQWRASAQSEHYTSETTLELLREVDSVVGYIIEHPTGNLVEADNGRWSICGLQPCELNTDRAPCTDKPSTDNGAKLTFQWTPTAKKIRQIMGKVANVSVDDIHPDNTIYHLGLDSISVVKVSTLLRKEGILIRPRDMLSAVSIADLVRNSSDRAADGTTTESTPTRWEPPSDIDVSQLLATTELDADVVEAALPASATQAYMLAAWQASEGAVFFPEFRFRAPSSIEPGMLKVAWQKLCAELPLLRTHFVASASKRIPYVQMILRQDTRNSTSQWVHCHLDADQAGKVLVLKIHHALYDAFSLPQLLNRLLLLARDEVEASVGTIDPDWLRYSIATADETQRQKRKDFWQQYLGQSHTTIGPSLQCGSLKARTSHLEENVIEDSKQLRQAASKYGASVQSIFLAAFARAICHGSAGNDHESVVIGVYLANRDEPAAMPMYPKLCIAPLKINVAPAQSITDSALAIQRDLRRISSDGMAEVGLWEIREWTGVTLNKVVNFIAQDTASDEVPELEAIPSQGDGADDVVIESMLPTPPEQATKLRNIYSNIVEVEASLSGEGLNIGVFGPKMLVSRDEATDLIHQIKSVLREGPI